MLKWHFRSLTIENILMIYSVFLAYAFSLDLVLMLAYNCIYSVIVSALFVVLCISKLLTYKRYSNSFDLWSVVWLIDNYWTVSLVIVWLIGGWSVDWHVCVCVRDFLDFLDGFIGHWVRRARSHSSPRLETISDCLLLSSFSRSIFATRTNWKRPEMRFHCDF